MARKEKQVKSTPDKPPVKKMTGEELEAKFDDWRHSKREAWENRDQSREKKVVRWVVSGLLCAGIAATAVAQGAASSNHRATMQSTEATIVGLQADLKTAQSVGDAEVVTSKELHELAVEATKMAEQVTGAQNKFATLYEQASEEMTSESGNGAPGESQEAIGTHRESLKKYFSPDDLLVDDKDVPIFTSVPSFERDEIDPRYEWYIKYEKAEAAPASSYGWQIETVMPSVQGDGQASVIWVNKDKSNDDVLAWAYGTYDQSQKAFTGLQLVTTSFGEKYEQETGSDREQSVPELIEGAK